MSFSCWVKSKMAQMDRGSFQFVKDNIDQALECEVELLFKPSFSELLSFQTDIFPYLEFFMTPDEAKIYHKHKFSEKHKSCGYKRLLNEFKKIAKAKFEDGVEELGATRNKGVFFKLKFRYDFSQIETIAPMMTRSFPDFDADMKAEFHSMSKIAIKRDLGFIPQLRTVLNHFLPSFFPAPPEIPDIHYYHTALMIKTSDDKYDVFEVKVNDFDRAIIEKNDIETAFPTEVHDPSRMCLDTRLIERPGNVNLHEVFFRLAFVLKKTVKYNPFGFNCDHFVNFIFFNKIEWSTKWFPVPSFLADQLENLWENYVLHNTQFANGEVDENKFQELKNWIKMHNELKM